MQETDAEKYTEFFRFIEDLKESENQWLIEGLLCNSLTLLSGEPKSGKSLLASHLIKSLVLNKEILGRKPIKQIERVGWIGFDANWQTEIRSRMQEIPGKSLYNFDPPNIYSNEKGWNWETIARIAKQKNVSLMVIDHLYGLSETANLDHAWEMASALKKIEVLYKEFNIPTLLIAQAGKGAGGRAAHSVQLEGAARHLLQLDGKGSSGIRTLKILSNISEGTSLRIKLSPEECVTSQSEKKEIKEKMRIRTNTNLPAIARELIQKSTELDRKTVSSLARFDDQNKISGRQGAKSCRTNINHLIKSGLIVRNPRTKVLINGPKLMDQSELN